MDHWDIESGYNKWEGSLCPCCCLNMILSKTDQVLPVWESESVCLALEQTGICFWKSWRGHVTGNLFGGLMGFLEHLGLLVFILEECWRSSTLVHMLPLSLGPVMQQSIGNIDSMLLPLHIFLAHFTLSLGYNELHNLPDYLDIMSIYPCYAWISPWASFQGHYLNNYIKERQRKHERLHFKGEIKRTHLRFGKKSRKCRQDAGRVKPEKAHQDICMAFWGHLHRHYQAKG